MKTVSLIYAVAENHTIGKNNKMPWHMPADFKHFKDITMGHPIIMGSRTFASIGKPLPGRQNIVLTRDRDFRAEGIDVAYSIEQAIAKADDDEVFVIGGAQVFQSALPLAGKVYETRLHAAVEGDTFFDPDLSHWFEESTQTHKADAKNPYDYTFTTYVRQ